MSHYIVHRHILQISRYIFIIAPCSPKTSNINRRTEWSEGLQATSAYKQSTVHRHICFDNIPINSTRRKFCPAKRKSEQSVTQSHAPAQNGEITSLQPPLEESMTLNTHYLMRRQNPFPSTKHLTNVKLCEPGGRLRPTTR